MRQAEPSTPGAVSRAGLWGALALVIAFILYGSLHPFFFLPGVDDVWTRVTTAMRTARAPGRGDLVANLVLYAPMGLLLVRLLPRALGTVGRLLVAVLLVGLMSFTVEALQAYIPERNSSLLDVGLNLVSGAAGGVVGLLLGHRALAMPGLLPGLRAEPFLALLLVAWLAYRLYPYVPAIDWFEWRQSLRGVILWPDPEWPRMFRLAVSWLVFAWLFQQLTGSGRARWLAPLLVIAAIGASIPIVGRHLSFAEVLAGGLAVLAWALIPPRAKAAPLLLALLVAAILVERLSPFTFLADPRPFGWAPFESLIRGRWEVGFQAMMHKAFLYGAMLWLAVRSGIPLPLAAALGAGFLFAASYAQSWLPQRSAEITEAVLVLGLAALMALLAPTRREAAAAPGGGPATASPPPRAP